MHLPEVQWRAIKDLKEQVQFLLKDEIATSLLDEDPVMIETLDLVTNHVVDSITSSSCKLDIVELDFVFNTYNSYEQFVEVTYWLFVLFANGTYFLLLGILENTNPEIFIVSRRQVLLHKEEP